MNIVFAINSMGKGGAERVISNLTKYLSKEHNVSIISVLKSDLAYELEESVKLYTLDKEFTDIYSTDNVHNKSFVKKIKEYYSRVKRLNYYKKKIKPDIIVSFMSFPSFIVLLSNKIRRIPTIVSIRIDPKKEFASSEKRNRILLKYLLPKADGFVFQTEEAKKFFEERIKMKSNIIIPNPINPDFIEKSFSGERDKVIVSVGRLTGQKNQKMIIEAFKEVFNKYDDYKLIIYGEGSLRNDLEKLIENLGLEDKVFLPGNVDNIKEKIYKASMFILASKYEGMPNALMEAMALGLPVISTDCPCGGPRFLIENNKNGILIKNENKQQLIEAMEKIIEEKELSKKMGKNATKIAKKLNPNNINKKWENYIDNVLENSKKNRSIFCKILYYLLHPRKLIMVLIRRRIIKVSDKKYLEVAYELKFNKKLDFENPKTFNEKLQWLKLYNRNPEYTKMVDKYEVKKYVAEKIGEEYIIPTIGVYEKFDDINFDKLPNKFVIKCTHDSGGICICDDKNKLNIKQTKEIINKLLKRNYYENSKEWPYKDVKPRIIIEKYMKNKGEDELKDYKFFCFNGQPKVVLVCSERAKNLKETFFDENWNVIELKEGKCQNDISIEKPINFQKMKELAQILAKDICFVRIDFYEINRKIFFGEITFYPKSGFEEFKPSKYDEILGERITLPKRKEKNEK